MLKLAPGDMVTMPRIDRLARSTLDLFAIVKQIVAAKAQFRSLAEPWADTGTSTGRLIIAVLGSVADLERDLIRTRTAEGRSRAQKRGQQMGRPPKLTDAEGGSTAATRGRRDTCETRPQLRCGQEYNFTPADDNKLALFTRRSRWHLLSLATTLMRLAG